MLVRHHHPIADRRQRAVDAGVVPVLRIQRADRVGVGVVMIRIGDAAGP